MARYIDAKELEKQLRKRINNGAIRGWLLSMINQCPAADVEPVKYGKWKFNCDGYYPYCSECNNEPDGGKLTKYCPNCGAKMDCELLEWLKGDKK